MSDQAKSELAPTGVLRAAINLSNFLLVTGKSASGDPEGVSPSMAAEIARRLGVPVKYIPYPNPGELADGAGTGVWDIGLIGAEPSRMDKLDFTPAYCEIEASYIVPAGSPFQTIADVDKPGARISVIGRSAYDLYLTRTLKHAELIRTASSDASFKTFVDEKLDALAGLKPKLLEDVEKIAGARIIPGRFTAVQQAICSERKNATGMAFLRDFVAEAKASGFVASLIERHKVRGLSVAGKA